MAIGIGAICSFATTEPSSSTSDTASYSQAATRIYYDGNAYSAGSGLIPKADGSVSVYWTSEGCSVNGKTGYQVQPIRGEFPMYINGKVKYMTHFVSYGGERYFFQI